MKSHGKYVVIVTFVLLANIGVSHGFEDDYATQVGRYVTVENKPKASQTDLLAQTIQVRFPQAVQTVGDAMSYVLRLSGYSLTPTNRMSQPLKTLLSKTLPAVDRDFGPMSLKDALSTLAGPAFYLVQDPLNRLVDFRVKRQFLQLYAENKKLPHIKQ